MPLDDQQLADLIDETEALTESIREDRDPEDAFMIASLEATYACLVELRAWRACYPERSMETLYITEYGCQGLQ